MYQSILEDVLFKIYFFITPIIQLSKTTTLLEFLKLTLTPSVTFLMFILGLRQYKVGQKWKKSEFAAREEEKLFTNEKLRCAIRFLDWPEFSFNIPEEYQCLAVEDSNEGYSWSAAKLKEKYNGLFQHNWHKVSTSMKPKEDPEKDYEWWEMMYREYFAELFDYFIMINHYVDIKLCRPEDLHHSKYYLSRIKKRTYFGKDITVKSQYWDDYGVFNAFWEEYYPNEHLPKLYKKLHGQSFKKREKPKQKILFKNLFLSN
jgi:hypothetical protein